MDINKESGLKISINYAIGGYLHREGEVQLLPGILREMAADYDRQIALEEYANESK